MTKAKNFKRILAAVDNSKQGSMALENAIHQALEDDARLYIATVFETNSIKVEDMFDNGVEGIQNKLEADLQKWKKKALDAGVREVDTVYTEDNKPGEAIVDEILEKVNADLIVIGAHSKGEGFFEKYLGSNVRYVATKSPVSVLIVR